MASMTGLDNKVNDEGYILTKATLFYIWNMTLTLFFPMFPFDPPENIRTFSI